MSDLLHSLAPLLQLLCTSMYKPSPNLSVTHVQEADQLLYVMRKLLQKLFGATQYERLQRQLLTACVQLLRILLTKAHGPVKVLC